MSVPIINKFYGCKIPIQKVRLEGLPSKIPTEPDTANPCLEMESTPFGQVKIRLGESEITLPGQLFLNAVTTVAHTKH